MLGPSSHSNPVRMRTNGMGGGEGGGEGGEGGGEGGEGGDEGGEGSEGGEGGGSPGQLQPEQSQLLLERKAQVNCEVCCDINCQTESQQLARP